MSDRDALAEAVCERLQTLRRPSTLTVRHDGARLVATVSEPFADPGERLRSRLWSFDCVDGRAQPLTDGSAADALPVFAPGDARLAFVSDRTEPGRHAVHVLGPDGTASGPHAPPDGTVETLCWAHDGASLLCTAAEAGLDLGATAGATPLAWGQAPDPALSSSRRPRRRLYRLHLDGRFESLLPAPWSAWEACSLDGGGALVVGSRDGSERGWYRAELLMVRAGGTPVSLYRPRWQLQCPAVSPDGRHAALLEGWASDRGLVAGTVHVVDLVDGSVRPLGGDVPLDDVCHVAWRDGRSLHFSAWADHGTRHGVVDLDGRVERSAHDDATLGPDRFSARVLPAGRDGAAVAVRESPARPARIVVRADASAHWRTLWAPEADVGGAPRPWPVPEPREIAWRAGDGLRIGALLWMPDGAGSPPPPMVVAVHGGPTSAARFALDPCGALDLVAAGYAVLLPNYRGSAGRGGAFARANLGDPAGAEFGDVLAGVARCVEDGLADPARVGITGVSYGGYLAAWAAATSGRFAAAVVTSGITDLVACHFDSNQAFCELIAGGDPHSRAARELMIERSPRYRLSDAHAPTLFLHGAEDRCTPVNQATGQHRALADLSVETELVVYPREGHALHEREHQLDARRRRRRWFDRHLGVAPGTASGAGPA